MIDALVAVEKNIKNVVEEYIKTLNSNEELYEFSIKYIKFKTI